MKCAKCDKKEGRYMFGVHGLDQHLSFPVCGYKCMYKLSDELCGKKKKSKQKKKK